MAGRLFVRGDVVLIPFPFSNLASSKLRPAVVLAADAKHADMVLAFVSSRGVTGGEVGDVSLLPTHPEFGSTGLAAPSRIRAGKLVTLATTLARRWLGRLGPLLMADLDRALVAALGITTSRYREEGRREERTRLVALHRSGGSAAVLADLGLSG